MDRSYDIDRRRLVAALYKYQLKNTGMCDIHTFININITIWYHSPLRTILAESALSVYIYSVSVINLAVHIRYTVWLFASTFTD